MKGGVSQVRNGRGGQAEAHHQNQSVPQQSAKRQGNSTPPTRRPARKLTFVS